MGAVRVWKATATAKSRPRLGQTRAPRGVRPEDGRAAADRGTCSGAARGWKAPATAKSRPRPGQSENRTDAWAECALRVMTAALLLACHNAVAEYPALASTQSDRVWRTCAAHHLPAWRGGAMGMPPRRLACGSCTHCLSCAPHSHSTLAISAGMRSRGESLVGSVPQPLAVSDEVHSACAPNARRVATAARRSGARWSRPLPFPLVCPPPRPARTPRTQPRGIRACC